MVITWDGLVRIPTLPTQSRIRSAGGESKDAEVVITEIGGTVGDIESQPFMEAIRNAEEVGETMSYTFTHLGSIPSGSW